ncbi:multidrug effflux MFS transporter [Novosphingobium sp. G106]|nr:multidrug effflux MFS transporter [Novosphingobium sp. G106]
MDSLTTKPLASGAKPFAMSGREFVALMALLQALQALAIDAMLPALGAMARDFGVYGSNERQLVIGVFLISSGLGSLFPGALADRFGRRPVLFICVGGYVVFSLAAALAPSFDALLAMRACAGVLSSGMVVLSATIIRDRFSGDKMARTQSLVSVVFMIVPMAAPSLGQAVLLTLGNWRWVFGIMAGLGAIVFTWAWLRLPETLHPEFRQPINVKAIAGNMRIALTTRAAVGYVFGMAFIQAALFGYINSSQQLVAEHFGAGELFPLVFGGMAVAMALTNLANSRIVMRFGARRVSHTALLFYVLTAAAQLIFASGPNETAWQFIPLMTLNLCLMGFISANFGSIALQPFARIAGAAASLQVFLRMVIGASLGALIGQAYDGSARPLAAALLAAGIGCLLLVFYSEHGKLFRRLHGQVQQV